MFVLWRKRQLSPSLRGNSDEGMHEHEGYGRKIQRWSLWVDAQIHPSKTKNLTNTSGMACKQFTISVFKLFTTPEVSTFMHEKNIVLTLSKV